MEELIDHSLQLIHDRPEEAKIINWVITDFDDDMKIAFKIAWRLTYDKLEV